MVGKEEDEKIQKITKLLEIGGTMLASHHECGAPMFRYQGKIICPVCDFPGKSESRTELKSEIKIVPEIKKERKQENKVQNVDMERERSRSGQEGLKPLDFSLEAIKEMILKKTYEMAQDLAAENDLSRVKEKMLCIEEGVKLVKLLQEL